MNVTANFSAATVPTYTLTVTSNPSSGGTVSLSPSGGTYASGTVVTLTAVPSSGYGFSSWSGSASGTNATTQVTISGNMIVAANFSTTTVKNYTLIVSSNPSAGGTVSLSPAGGTYASGTVVTLTAVPASGYNFSIWSGNASGTNPTTQITMTANMSVLANFSATVQQYTLTVTSNPSSGGTVSLSPSGGTYPSGTVVTITASPSSNYGFTSWSGNASGTNATTQITMTANESITANFNLIVGGTVLFNLTNPCADAITIAFCPPGSSTAIYSYTNSNGSTYYTSLSSQPIFTNVTPGTYVLYVAVAQAGQTTTTVLFSETAVIASGTNAITLTRTSGTCGGNEYFNLSWPQ